MTRTTTPSTHPTATTSTSTSASGPWLQVPMCTTPVSTFSYGADEDDELDVKLDLSGTSLSSTSTSSDVLDPTLYDYSTSISSSAAASPPSLDMYSGSLFPWASPASSTGLSSSLCSGSDAASSCSSCAPPTTPLADGADTLLYEPYLGDVSDLFGEYPSYQGSDDSSVLSSQLLFSGLSEKTPYAVPTLPVGLDIPL